MDHMHDQDDALNIKVILLGVGGAAAAALLLALRPRSNTSFQRAHGGALSRNLRPRAILLAGLSRRGQVMPA